MIHPDRIRFYGDLKLPVKGDYVLYWMQQSQRVLDNHALAYAIEESNRLGKPLLVLFALVPDFPEANARHYWFMLQGLRYTASVLADMGIKFLLRLESPPEAAGELSRRASLVVADMGYLRIQRKWRQDLARSAPCPVVQLESDVIVPVESASEKEQYSAATLRPRIHRKVEEFLHPLVMPDVEYPSLNKEIIPWDNRDVDIAGLDNDALKEVMKDLNTDTSVSSLDWISGGTDQALIYLDSFICDRLEYFNSRRNDPSRDFLSNMSPYLHFGQISPLTIALKAIKSFSGPVYGSGKSGEFLDFLPEGIKSFLEELIVRRELSMNFTHYNDEYDSIVSLPDWAGKTLDDHRMDYRPLMYTLPQLEYSLTHDEYWNTCQREMFCRGKMHGYMRMYWGKKIIEWSETAEEAYRNMVYLNNKYSIDGRDPNAYTGIAWCFGKHDRAWKERSIFGKVRYMNARGLERKFDINAYVERVKDLCPALE